ncbi:MAG: YqaJ viral recombinase family protein [Erysipelotrichaceae bacterium]|nr:YqaJ viral recombinase family protein [Erysipelotrichaceae bacterium]
MKIQDSRIIIDPIKNPKKITATKLSGILGIGTSAKYNTPFQIWCDITRVYPKPFEENKYTIAGQAIEPKQLQYFRDFYKVPNLVTPEEKYGPSLKHIWDFFPDEPIFGGKWDSITVEQDNPSKVRRIIECKTAQEKKRDQWQIGIPEDYKVQACMYATLLGVDGITYIVSFLKPKDYDDPGSFVLNQENTILKQLFISRDYPDYQPAIIAKAEKWWSDHVLTGVSPMYDANNTNDIKIVTELLKTMAPEEIRLI